jgi:predicted nucleotidyltransferase
MLPKNIQEEIDNIVRQIKEKYRPEKIILFGSAAAGNFKPDSDLDFLIIKKNTPHLGRDRCRQLRKLIIKNVAADFLVYQPEELKKRQELGDPFIKSILTQGQILYGT